MDTPFYKGEVQCCVVDNPVCDLILGNLPDVFDEPKLSVATARDYSCKENGGHSSDQAINHS